MDTRSRSLTPLSNTRPNTRRREVAHAGLTWVDLTQPSSADAPYLRDRFSLDMLSLEDLVSTIQHPKLDMHPQHEYLFLVLHIPTLDRDNRVLSSEVDLFVGRDFVITAHDGGLKPLRRLFAAAATDEAARTQLLGRGPGYLLFRVLDALVKSCFPLVYRIDDELERLEGRLLGDDPRALVREVVALRRDLIALEHLLRPDQAALHALRGQSAAFLRLDPARYIGDNADGLDRLCAMVGEQAAVLDGLQRAMDSLSALRVAQGQRLVTLVLLLLVPAVLAASLAGLNALVAFDSQPLLFGAAFLVLLLITGALAAFVYYRRLL